MYERPTFKENGIIYDGDYYLDIPYHKYIKSEERPKGPIFDVRDYGAVPKKHVLSTEAFQRALDDASQAHGTVLVTGGSYTTGTISIKSDTVLFIEEGSSINASKDLTNFKDAFVQILNSKNVQLRGGGKINGNGEYFVYLPHERPLLEPLGYTKLPPVLVDPMGSPEDTSRYKYRERIRYAEDKWNEGKKNINRPMYTLWVRGSDGVEIKNIVIRDSMDWSLSIDGSENVLVESIVIDNNRHVANTDGIDIMGSRNVKIKHVFVSTADDGLCIKSPMIQGHDSINVADESMSMGPTENVEIEDAEVISVMNAFKIGTETYFDIKNIKCKNCIFHLPDIYPGGVSGISIESADGAKISNVCIENITMDNIAVPIFMMLNKRNKFGFLSEDDRKEKENGGSIRDIRIENVVANNMESSCIITGFKDNDGNEGRIKDIRLKNIDLTYLDNEERLNILDEIKENVYDYPESNALGDMPSYGFYIRHADDVKFENVRIKPRGMNKREMIAIDDVNNFSLD